MGRATTSTKRPLSRNVAEDDFGLVEDGLMEEAGGSHECLKSSAHKSESHRAPPIFVHGFYGAHKSGVVKSKATAGP